MRPQEQLLIDTVPEMRGEQIVCTSAGRAQFAAAAARYHPATRVFCNFIDLYQANRARRFHREALENLSISCRHDLPQDQVNVVAFPFSAGGEAELTRDLLQSGHRILKPHGRMFTSTDNPKDKWLHKEMKRLFPKVTRRPHENGVVYIATKKEPLRKLKNFECRFAFRDRGRLIQAVSRPGVFSHRKIDPGARALIDAMEVRDRDRVLDVGCGSGVVSLAAALRARDVFVQAIDSNARAVQCTQKGAELNRLSNVETQLEAQGQCQEPESFDLLVANPPYYSHYRIAEIFLQKALHALKPGGKVQIVTQKHQWYVERMIELFDGVSLSPGKKYFIVTGTQRRGKNK